MHIQILEILDTGCTQLSAPEVVTGTYNGSVTISCQYSLQFKEYTKYWCKGQVYELCTIIVKTPKVRQNDRSSIVDDKEAGVFTVTMTLLQKTDEDMYWCVIARHGRNIFSRVRLLVSDTVFDLEKSLAEIPMVKKQNKIEKTTKRKGL
uniref:Immunoglobulin domain-containing protein n=1 Tax=Stegastes partitus TaxID=144197 RepID=A0A3B5AM99_9TELE